MEGRAGANWVRSRFQHLNFTPLCMADRLWRTKQLNFNVLTLMVERVDESGFFLRERGNHKMTDQSALVLPIAEHFTMLVYTFRHAVDGSERAERLRNLSVRWRPWWYRFEPRAAASVFDDTYFFLP